MGLRDGGRERVDRARGLRRVKAERPKSARDVDRLEERVESLEAVATFLTGQVEGLRERNGELEKRLKVLEELAIMTSRDP